MSYRWGGKLCGELSGGNMPGGNTQGKCPKLVLNVTPQSISYATEEWSRPGRQNDIRNGRTCVEMGRDIEIVDEPEGTRQRPNWLKQSSSIDWMFDLKTASRRRLSDSWLVVWNGLEWNTLVPSFKLQSRRWGVCAIGASLDAFRIINWVKQSWHWHYKGFTPWHAIWRYNEGRTRNSVRRDEWQCVSGKVVRAMLWQKFEMFKNSFPRCHDLSRRNR